MKSFSTKVFSIKNLFTLLITTLPTLSLAHDSATSFMFHHLVSAHHAYGGLAFVALLVFFIAKQRRK